MKLHFHLQFSIAAVAILTSVLIVVGCAHTDKHKTQQKEAFGKFEELAEELAEQYVETTSARKKEIIAVLCALRNRVQCNTMGSVFADKLTSELFKKGRKVIDRPRVRQLLKEQKFEQRKIYNNSTVMKIGRLLGAEVLGLGDITKVGHKIVISYRFVEPETGTVVGLAEVDISERKAKTLFQPKSQIYRITKVYLKLKRREWDISSTLADPRVYMQFFGKTIRLPHRSDTREASWSFDRNSSQTLFTFSNNKKREIYISVWDEDAMSDDCAGSFRFQNEEAIAKLSDGEIVIEDLDGVAILKIEFEKAN